MKTFKDYVAQDINNLFFSTCEFGEIHNIDGKDMTIVIDNEHLQERSKKEYDGISVGEILYYVRASEYGAKLQQGEYQVFDNKIMQIFDVREDSGIYEIILRRNE